MSKRECPFGESSTTKNVKFDAKMTTEELRKLYGPVKGSIQKKNAVKMAMKEESIVSIAGALKVKVATAEVYILDGFVAGAPLNHTFLAQQLDVEEDFFKAVESEVNPSLRTIKDNLESSGLKPTYNEIRFVIACMIRGLSL